MDYYSYAKEYENLEELKFDKILICGMGGSGIIGDYLKVLLEDKIIVVCKDYDPPKYIHSDWLAILISYSGNTEETISCLEKLPTENIVIVSANGKLEKIAKERKYKFIKIPKDFPATRYSFPVLLASVLSILDKSKYYILLELLKNYKEKIRDYSYLAEKINNPVIIYTDTLHFPCAWYFKMRLNEDSKHYAKVSILPEANHHELEALDKLPFDFIFLNYNYSSRIRARYEYVKRLLEDLGNNVYELDFRYRDLFEELIYSTLSFESITLNLAKRKGVDPYRSYKIEKLKEYLAKL